MLSQSDPTSVELGHARITDPFYARQTQYATGATNDRHCGTTIELSEQ